MTKLQGSHIWYELMTSDPAAAAQFYEAVIGWKIRASEMPGMDYRLCTGPDGDVGGIMPVPAAAPMSPAWFGYIGVDEIDASVASIAAAGGTIHMPVTEIPGVGRIAMVADPQGVLFYVMTPAGEGQSVAFSPGGVGACGWNELATSNQPAALDFYSTQFGWTQGEAMDMGAMGEYRFISHDGIGIGAVMPTMPDAPKGWRYYLRVVDIDAAAARITAGGGRIDNGPHEVPTGDMIIQAVDPQGGAFALVGKRVAK
jgi:uncharacterized protein